MQAWWESFWTWFGALEPPAQIAAVVAAVATLGGALKWLKDNFGSKPAKPPPALPISSRIIDESPGAVMVGGDVSGGSIHVHPPAVPPPATAGAVIGRYVDLAPDERALVEQAVDAFRRRVGRGEPGLAAAVAAAEEGNGAKLIAKAESEYAQARGPQARAEAAWRLAGLVYPEDKRRALALYREATQAAPHQAAAWLGLSRALAETGAQDQAAEALSWAEARAREPKLKAAVLAERARRALTAGEASVALKAAGESVALWRPFSVEPGPSGEEAQAALASALGTQGRAATDLGDLAQARARLEEAVSLTTYLATRRPSDAERAWAAGAAADLLADLEEAEGAASAEAEAREAALLRLKAEASAASAARRETAVTAVKIGDSLRGRGDAEGARGQYAEALEIFDEIALKDPASATAKRDRAVALERLGDAAFALGDWGEARARYEANLQIREARAAADPSDAEARRDLALSLIKLADLGRAQGEPGAERRYARALDLARGLSALDPRNVSAAHVLVLALDRAATVAPEPEAKALYAEILTILRPLAEADRLSADQKAALNAVEAHVAGLNAA
ncbi:tetratricopeptide repeat protein [Neomegalonema perideroedes]|uniref:tetratricopeptide repeat protein n=1 Tax=Neomegalonema perideroedes TaxID=217219 RepID=UPI00039DD856|nr:tetratricopeptide repeat protein [Neomegalonema perideroedes]